MDGPLAWELGPCKYRVGRVVPSDSGAKWQKRSQRPRRTGRLAGAGTDRKWWAPPPPHDHMTPERRKYPPSDAGSDAVAKRPLLGAGEAGSSSDAAAMAPGSGSRRPRGGVPGGGGSRVRSGTHSMHARPAAAWQQPFLNVFRHFRVDEWKRAAREGDVAAVADQTLRCRVYRIRGAASASNYLQLPPTGSQSLGLTGRYVYVLFRPLPDKHFVIHLDVATDHAQVIRVSFSNLFKEFKSTATWLQFPLVYGTSTVGEGGVGLAPCQCRWTCLQVDLQDTLLIYLSQRYSHLRGMRLCASLLVRSVYTSDLSFNPTITVAEARRSKLSVTPVPREMAFPVPKGKSWSDLYLHIRWAPLPCPVPVRCLPRLTAMSHPGFPLSARVQPPHSARRTHPLLRQQIGGTVCALACSPQPLVCKASSLLFPVAGSQDARSWRRPHTTVLSRPTQQFHRAHRSPKPNLRVAGSSIPPFANPSAADPVAQPKRFLPDPILRLKGIIGFGGSSARWALWTRDGTSILYPCHAVIVLLHIRSLEQRFFLGHTDEVSALALDGKNRLLVSAQVRPSSMLRLWDLCSGQCLSLLRCPVPTICSLSLSDSGALLCGVGKDHHGRTVVVAWGTEQVGYGGEVAILAKAHTDVDIQAFVVSGHDETRMASCGRGSVRLWRLRGGVLRSCPVDLGEYHALDFTDLDFAKAQDHTLYACSRSGHVLELDSQCLAVRHARRLLPAQAPSSPVTQKWASGSGPIAISSLSVSQTLCAVGSEDGHLRLWPLDFSTVLLETGHEGPIAAVRVSPDGRCVLSTTSSGLLGFLDVEAQEYCVLMRAHTSPVLGLATKNSHRQLATVGLDRTVRVWDLSTLQQLYDLMSPEDAPCIVAFHPTQPLLFCGFSSGAMRACNLDTSEVLLELRCHREAITGLATSPDGHFLFSSCSQGILAQYRCAATQCQVLRVAADMVWQEACGSSLAVSSDSRLLAFVGPSGHTVTVADTASLEQLLQVDLRASALGSSRVDFAVAICFGPAPPGHLLVSTSSALVLVLDAMSGHVVQELSGMQPPACPSLALSADGRLLLMAADQAIKVWDCWAQARPRCQVFIGHSAPVRAVAFTPDHQQVLSVGDAIFLWDVLASEVAPQSAQSLPAAPEPCETGPVQLEGTKSKSSEWPCAQTPVCGHSVGLARLRGSPEAPGPSLPLPQDVTSAWDHKEVCEKNPDLRVLGQASGHPVLLGREAGMSADGAWGAGEPPKFGESLGPHSWLRAQHVEAPHPDARRHFTAHCKCVSWPPAGGEGLHLKAVVGYSGSGRANLVWRPDTGFFAYTSGRLLVVEDLHSGTQHHWLGHADEVSTLALSHSAQLLASASGHAPGHTNGHGQIHLWNVPGGSCQHLIRHQDAWVRALAFSPDDQLLISLGDSADCSLAMWRVATAELLVSLRLPEPALDVAFSPWDAGQLACVGQGGLSFWLLPRHGAGLALQAHREPLPQGVEAAALTSLCFGAVPLLFCGSSAGHVCVWDTCTRSCILAWQADDGAIGLLLCSGPWLVSGSDTRWLRLWAVGAIPELRRTGSAAGASSVVMEQELSLDGAVVSAVFHESMDMGVVGTTAGTVWFVSWAQGTSTRLISGHYSQVNEVAFSPSEAHCATCSDDGSVRVWSLTSLELLVQFQVRNQQCLCVTWSPASCGRAEQQRVAAGYSDGTLRVFSISRTAMELRVQPHSDALTAIAFSADGQSILSGDRSGYVAVSRLNTGVTLRVLSDHHGAPICTLQSTSKEYEDFGVKGMDLWLAASGDQRVSVWASNWLRDHCELVDWLSFPAPTLEGPDDSPPSLAAFCPWDQALLVCAGLGLHRELAFYSLHWKKVVKTISLPAFALSLSLSSSLHLAAIGFADRVLRLVDCRSGAAQDFAAHKDTVQLCRFSPSAHLLFSAAHSEILVWEVVPTALSLG
ncbi:WD repeat-containing protein 90 [Suncus etruscus]|uniref:WD repeat-containing protein 90 n=1 Tax=Suncus etruscus TaxID=109475 RepID=UPI00210F946D|nr:WD repeat-containing protein 90 [Suncus etruscus]